MFGRIWPLAVFAVAAVGFMSWSSLRQRAQNEALLVELRAWGAAQPKSELVEVRPWLEPALPGDAATAWREAMRLAVERGYRGDAFVEELNGRFIRVPDLALHRELWAPVLEAVVTGARSSAMTTLFAVEEQTALALSQVAGAAGFEAEGHLATGASAEAVDATIAAAALAVACTTEGALVDELTGAAELDTVLGSFWSSERLERLPREPLRRLAAAVERVDRQLLPTLQSLEREVAWIVAHAGQEEAAVLDAVRRQVQVVRLLREMADLPWPEREEALRAALPDRHAGPGRSRIAVDYVWLERQKREAVARIRLLRLELAHRLGAPLPSLADPLGDGPLLVETGPGTLRLSSAGSSADAVLVRLVPR